MIVLNRLAATAATLLLSFTADTRADPTPPTTTLTVPEMDCPECAKKLTAKLLLVAGVAKAEANVEKAVVTLTPKAGEKIPPKALWEASEKAGFDPTKLVGPDGTFTAKPK